MKLYFLILFTILQFVNALCQPFAIGLRTLNLIDGSRNNRVISTDIYYPAQSSGNNTALVIGNNKFPVVVFGHGFSIQNNSYKWLADSIVKYGYIVAMPNTELSLSPNHEEFGRDLAFTASRILSFSDSANSFLFNRVLNKSAVGGHSMGGGCSFLAMSYNTTINALFNFAAAETNPSALMASLSIQKPSLIFSGSKDCIVPDSTQLKMYQRITYSCKTYININNALHCHFSNNDFTCSIGQITSNCNTSSINSSIVFEKISYLLIPFLNHYLKNNCEEKTNFNTRYQLIEGVAKQQLCNSDPQSNCIVTNNLVVNQLNDIKIYPNPIINNDNLYIETSSYKQLVITIISLSGKIIDQQKISGLGIHLIQLPAKKGTYFIKITDKNQRKLIQKLYKF